MHPPPWVLLDLCYSDRPCSPPVVVLLVVAVVLVAEASLIAKVPSRSACALAGLGRDGETL